MMVPHVVYQGVPRKTGRRRLRTSLYSTFIRAVLAVYVLDNVLQLSETAFCAAGAMILGTEIVVMSVFHVFLQMILSSKFLDMGITRGNSADISAHC